MKKIMKIAFFALIVGALYNCGQLPLNCDISDEACLENYSEELGSGIVGEDSGISNPSGVEVTGEDSLSMDSQELGGVEEMDSADNEAGGSSAPATNLLRSLPSRGTSFISDKSENEAGGS